MRAAAALALALAVQACAPRAPAVLVLSSASGGPVQIVELPPAAPTPAETATWIGVVLDALKAAAAIAAPIVDIVRGQK